MTIISGIRIVGVQCCGARYAMPRYASMNFLAQEYWTDGWRHGSLMPNDEGLRQCVCGRYFLQKHSVTLETAKISDLRVMKCVPAAELAECIASAEDERLEIAARLMHWRHLNHVYREHYRQHREAEEVTSQAKWENTTPDQRTWWSKLRGQPPPSYRPLQDRPFSLPLFEATEQQLENMRRLSEILLPRHIASRRGYSLELAELYREQCRFDEAQQVIFALEEHEVGVTSNLILKLINEQQPAPIRYRI